MQIQILPFGKLKDILPDTTIDVPTNSTVAMLRMRIEKRFPELKNQKYSIAIDKQIVDDTDIVNTHCEVALLPPFSKV